MDNNKRRPPAFQFYAKDFYVSTIQMDLRVRGAYITLLCYQWENDFIPTDHAKLTRILGVDKKEFDEIWPELKDKFPNNRNPRLEITRKKQKEFAEASSKAGKKGGGNPNFHKGRPNPYKGSHKGNDKGGHKGLDKDNHKPASASASASSPTIAFAEKDIPANAGTPQAEFVKKWSDLYQTETGHPYKAGDAEYTLVTKLLKDFGEAEVLFRARILFAACRDRSVWFTKNGFGSFTIKQLSNKFNELTEEGECGKHAGVSRSEIEQFLANRAE